MQRLFIILTILAALLGAGKQWASAQTTPKPDLTMSEFIRSPLNSANGTTVVNPPVLVGTALMVTGTVRNNGTANSPATKLRFYLSTDITYSTNDVALGFINGNALSVGQMQMIIEHSLTIPATTAAGTYYVLARVDANNQANESNENNNLFHFVLSVVTSTAPDLLADMPIAAASATRNTAVSVGCRVRNNGANAALASSLRCYISSDATYSTNDVQVGSVTVAALTGGGMLSKTLTINIPNTVAVGSKHLLFRCDAASQVTEANENNNVLSKPITVN